MSRYYCILLLSLFAFTAHAQSFTSFYQAKQYLSKQVSDETRTLYCGCNIKKQEKKLVPDTASCGYTPRLPYTRSGKVNARAHRIEWEHIVSAWEFGHQLQCWQDGGRKHCRKVSEQFRKMEADIHNLAPAIGEVNGDRSNFRFGMLPSTEAKYGACPVKIDFKLRRIEPPHYARKRIAEAYFYMEKTYGLKISAQQRKLFTAWQKQ
ncbi:endonuclease [Pseudoalteromonas piscicida]|uniref:Endonuclease I n=1 Tax=Pseudoalteromonas piscicida TaxID=43662 RepID=A0A2A5JMZ6_PSEO7|nr:endonuclease [Pseudoalteromonas piscicida]PCK30805.1 endonuclease I [Pseudoalteromonas piscicida]